MAIKIKQATAKKTICIDGFSEVPTKRPYQHRPVQNLALFLYTSTITVAPLKR